MGRRGPPCASRARRSQGRACAPPPRASRRCRRRALRTGATPHHRERNSATLFVTREVRTPWTRSSCTTSTTGGLIAHSSFVVRGRRVAAFGDAVLAEDGLHPLPRVDDRDLAPLGPVPRVIAVLVRAQEGDGERLEVGAFVSGQELPRTARDRDHPAEVEEGCVDPRHGPRVWQERGVGSQTGR